MLMSGGMPLLVMVLIFVIDDAVVYDAVVSGYSCIHSNASLSFGDQIHDEAIPRFGSDDDYFRDEYEDVA